MYYKHKNVSQWKRHFSKMYGRSTCRLTRTSENRQLLNFGTKMCAKCKNIYNNIITRQYPSLPLFAVQN